MQNERQTFKKEEKLKSKKLIEELFEKGKIIHHHPFKVLFQLTNNPEFAYPAKIGISVSKKNFKRAVDRNYLKRKIREAYRCNKSDLYNSLNHIDQKLYFFVIYTAKHDIDYSEIDLAMISLLKKLKTKF